jgi:hypothetical protein
MDNNYCLLCNFFPVYKHKSSIQFMMKRHYDSKCHKLKLLLNKEENISEKILIEKEKRKYIKRQAELSSVQIIKKDCIIHFKV